MLFDSSSGFLGSSYPMKTVDFEVLRDVAMANIFWLSMYAVHIGAARRIRLKRPCAAAMQPYVRL